MLVTTKVGLRDALATNSLALSEVGTSSGGAPRDTSGRSEGPFASHKEADTKRRPGPVWGDMYRRNCPGPPRGRFRLQSRRQWALDA
jgi:hypothetical protein